MNPDDLIESYVGDVIRRLPRKIRSDVGYELRALLEEELRGRAEASGRTADSALAMELLADFGRPVDVADRYRPAGFTIIRPSDAPRFAWIALGGVALQWIVSLIATFASPSDVEWLSRLGAWWTSWGLGSFWWPGLLVSLSIVGASIAHGRNSAERSPRVSELDRDRVNRFAIAIYIALGLVGASIVIAIPSMAVWGSTLPQPLLAAFALDDEFLTWRAPWVLVFWTVSLAVGIVLLVTGRWTRVLRRVELTGGILGAVLLAVWVGAGPIFVAQTTDGPTKAILVLLTVVILIDVVITVRRTLVPVRVPAV